MDIKNSNTDNNVLQRMSGTTNPFVAPYVCLSPPGEGCTLLLTAANEGLRTLAIVSPGRMPPQYSDRVAAAATVIEMDVKTPSGFRDAMACALESFDAIFFLGGPYETDDSDLFELEIVSLYLLARLRASGRVITLASSGTPINEVPDEPLTVAINE